MAWVDVFQGLAGIVAMLLAVLAVYVLKKTGILDKWKNLKIKDEIKQQIADMAVQAVQQIYENYNGKDKYEEARKRISNLLAERGIEVSEEEIEVLIEQAVKRFKSEFKESWDEENASDVSQNSSEKTK